MAVKNDLQSSLEVMLELSRLLIVCVHFAWSFNIVMVFLANVVAPEVALMVLDQRLEVEVW